MVDFMGVIRLDFSTFFGWTPFNKKKLRSKWAMRMRRLLNSLLLDGMLPLEKYFGMRKVKGVSESDLKRWWLNNYFCFINKIR